LLSLSKDQFGLPFSRGTDLILRHGLRDSAIIIIFILPSAEGGNSG
jgi:hypothetical protein